MKVRRTGHETNCWRSGDELISDVLQMDPLTWPIKSSEIRSNLLKRAL